MKYLSIIILAIFVNFTALPSLAVVFDWELPTLNTNITEEEVKNSLANFNEKLPPKPYHFKDFFEPIFKKTKTNSFVLQDDSVHLSPYQSIFSPPPEV